jgi:hypothetical protein
MTKPVATNRFHAALLALATFSLAWLPHGARADEPQIACHPWAILRHSIEAASGTIIELDAEQFNFARGAFMASPPVSFQLPPGDRAVMATVQGRAGILFLDGDAACDAGALPPGWDQVIRNLGEGASSHVGDGT